MLDALLSFSLTHGPILFGIEALGVLALLALLISRRSRRWLPIAAAVAVGGAVVGYSLCWLLSDVINVFGVSLSLGSRAWFSAAVAAIAVAIARLVWSRGRKLAAILAAILLFALVGGVGINVDLGQFPNLRTALGIGSYGDIQLPAVDSSPATTTLLAGWAPPANLPTAGRIGLVTIPATTSGFHPRSALVYLPPAALVRHPPRLPMLEMMSGQPGGPEQAFTSGSFGASLNAYAKAHHGLAPIVVVPDQLGAPNRNPMCVDSDLGNSATYMTVDVPTWIRSHLNVLAGRTDWAVGGFSQGGTCAIQFGAGLPDIYGGILDIAGEIAPANGDRQHTIDAGFGGSKSRYLAATPREVLRANSPYDDTLAIFAVGQLDVRFGAEVKAVADFAGAAGMKVDLLTSPGTAHDWHTVHFAFDRALLILGAHWGLS
ncbi:hypothetical protein [Glaciihabitans sp. UYNi722]|uniref:alpha/beta hydrolase n=1 Tax=Glaciihabitans sp. UYNi722 TaxID=3156344 RepID=UPI00339571FC